MSKLAASLPVPAIKSQIAAMAGNVATLNPQSTVARLVHGELKGGEQKHNFIMSIISDAILQAYKGNQRDIPEAMKLCAGKAVKAKAFYAGFHAIADMVKPIPYAGKFDAANNADVRATIIAAAQHASVEFERAYLDVFAVAKAEAADKKAAKAAETSAAASSAAAAGETVEGAMLAEHDAMRVDTAVVDIGATIAAVADAIRMGFLTLDELAQLHVAIAAYETSDKYAEAIARAGAKTAIDTANTPAVTA